MKSFLLKLLPQNKRDLYFYYLFLVAILPLIYLCLKQQISYMLLNYIMLLFFCIILIFEIMKTIRTKEVSIKSYIKSPAFILLFFMFLWIFISSFFAYNTTVSLWGFSGGHLYKVGVLNYIFYFAVAVSALKLKKENITYIISLFMIVACIIILIQFNDLDYSLGFIHKNHTGYYLCMTLMLSVGMFLFSKKILLSILSIISVILHFISLIMNGSMGPIVGIIAFLAVGLIYIIIHKRKLFVNFFAVLVSFFVVISICDYVPKIKDLRDESATTVEKVVDIGIAGLIKIGIISEKSISIEELSPGSDGYARFDMWKRAIDNMIELPLFGTGVGCWDDFNPDMPNPKPHNEFLEYGATSGIPSLLIYLTLIIYLFIKFRKSHKNQTEFSFIVFMAILVYLVQSIFGNVMPFTAPLFYLLIGFAIREIDFTKKEEKIEQSLDEKTSLN